MSELVLAIRWAGIGLLGGLFSVLASRLLTGRINLHGLLAGDREEGSFSPARAQLLLSTVLGGMQYLLQMLQAPSVHSLPPLPDTLVALLGGSQLVYLGGKAWSSLGNKKVDSLK